MNQSKLTGKIALVTGGSRGIGKSIARILAAAGAFVIVNYNTNRKNAEDIVEEISNKGGKAIALQADVSNAQAVDGLFKSIEEQVGSIDILVNNAGVAPVKPHEDISPNDWEEVLNINLTSAFLTIKAAIPAMKQKQYGRIINISSVAAQTGGVIGPHYAASKAGMLGLTHSYASLLAAHGITVNAIAPALVETDMIKDNEKITPELLPVKRFGQPEEVADVALLLACNGYVSGQTINVNGGMHMS
ncbi:3-oxoacyl-ACP reductase FabG [Mucilaginibacter sp. Bleaf8]|uniref:3-oxoacyl-ACP reductase family protein n=1 Tax=Mucilaginibacter sp. Bleaf8 TaxID=2834430 RepID=UPI001BCB48E2|nr:3-oxoacyl-ACP reductase family protein [Mucilaginibacter sp. Bleaf8]MBS7563476.1 3-oxoacyl-ACP reductase FabG [Mucilaginibacter sp. Bleaf8]